MQREVTLIFGQTGSGKTTFARSLLDGLQRALVAEANFAEYPALPFADFGLLVAYLEKINARSPASFFKVSYSPRLFELPLIFDLALSYGPLTLLLEEADRFEDPRYCIEYDEVITRGRHYGVSIVALALHPFKIPIELRRQATKIVCYRQIDPQDLRWLSEVMGEAAYSIPSLPAFTPLIWIPSTGI